MALTNKLTNIADAIREKTGSTAPMTLDDMATAITNIQGGGDGDSPTIHFTGNCSYADYNGVWDNVIEQYKNKITSRDITTAANMFLGSNLKEIPDLNFINPNLNNAFKSSSIEHFTNDVESIANATSTFDTCLNLQSVNLPELQQIDGNAGYMFNGCAKLESINLPKLTEIKGATQTYLFADCTKLNNINAPCLVTTGSASMFRNCNSLRSLPFKIKSGSSAAKTLLIYYYGFYNCFVLDEICDLGVASTTLTSDAFTGFVNYCYRLKKLTFATNEDGTPIKANWKSQVIDLSQHVGSAMTSSAILDANVGLTEATLANAYNYDTLKDHPDYWTAAISLSRYHHDSAVETINSLPDTSEYLATAGGTNTIKFKGVSGGSTDQGAINTLTDAEIAVATAKGWTVTFS